MALLNSGNGHVWKFFRAGGTDQVKLETGEDILSIDALDQKLWVALSCPTRGLEFDPKTLDFIDLDKDGRVRAPEMIAAVKWTARFLKDLSDLKKGSDTVPLSAINDATPEGKQLLTSARRILADLGKKDATGISVADMTDTGKILALTKFNGDGILPPESSEEPFIQGVIKDILTTLGGEKDRGGNIGITQAKADQFFQEAEAFANWQTKAEADATILPMGGNTGAALAVHKTVKAKIDDYFARCRLAAFDNRALNALNRQETEYLVLAAKDLSITAEEVAGFPLARIEAGKPLPLKEALNPAWADRIAQFHDKVIRPLLGERTVLNEADWLKINATFAGHEAWLQSKAGALVEPLGLPRIREILNGKSKESIAALIAKDKALESEAQAVADLDRLTHYYRDLYQLLNNFVAFADFYSGKRKAIFQAGTLYLDGRSCELCVRVEDAAKHGALASMSKTYLAYCDCTRKGSTDKLAIAAAFTGGDSDYLMVGRNGVFYDRKGQDWDATITKIVDHPISIRQAFWSPYKKMIKLVEDQIEKFASAREKAVQEKAAAGMATAAKTAQEGKPLVAQQAFDVGKTVGIFAAIGLALGAIGTAVAAIIGAFMALPWWQKPIALVAVMILISGPSMIIAWLKLRQRNLGPILDANGWAINGRASINIPFGGALTDVAHLPANSERSLTDPYAEKKHTGQYAAVLVVLLIIAAAAYGWYHYRKSADAKPAPAPAPITTNVVVTNTAAEAK